MRWLLPFALVALGPAAGQAQDGAPADLRPDFDGDGLVDDDEAWPYGTLTWSPDTDGDGVSDYVEIQQRSDPLSAGPAPVPPDGGSGPIDDGGPSRRSAPTSPPTPASRSRTGGKGSPTKRPPRRSRARGP